MSSNIRFVVAGFGRIGQRHCTIIHEHPHTELVAVIDNEPALETTVAHDFDVPFFTRLEDFFRAGIAADVLCVCTPNGLHAAQAIQALERELHVVCEKPMGLSKANCEQVIHKSLQVHRHVFCVMQNRYSPPAVWLKSLMEEQRLGKMYLVQINCYWNRGADYFTGSTWKGTLHLDGGPLFTQFSHFVDIMFWLFGDIEKIRGRFANFNHQNIVEFEDSGYVNFEFTGMENPLAARALGAFNYSISVNERNLESSLTIIGEKGTVKVGGQYMEDVEYCEIQDYEMPQLQPVNPPNDYGKYKGSAANHHFVIQNVVDTLTGNSVITTNALEGLKVVEMIERIYRKRK